MLKIHPKCVAGAVREELNIIFGQNPSRSLQFDFDVVVCSSIRGAVETKTDNEYTFVDTELNAIATSTISPLIVSIRGRLESVADLRMDTILDTQKEIISAQW